MKKAAMWTMAFLTFLGMQAQAEDGGQGLVINEVMQSNISALMVDGDFPDSWVELYNASSSDLDLGGYALGEDNDVATAYPLPQGTGIKAGGHLVVYCDKEAKGLHTDFRVDAGNAQLFLFDHAGALCDSVTLPPMPAPCIAYGRSSDGADEWYHELSSTPGAPNSGGGSEELLPDPVFNVTGGTFSEPFSLTVELPADAPADAFIFLTFDGTEPTIQSLSCKQYAMKVKSTTIVRAKLITRSRTQLQAPPVTHSYIFHPRETTLPVVSIVTNRDYLYDASIGILTPTVNDGVPNYMRPWRRPVNIEYFRGDDSEVFNQLAETAVSGVSTREQVQKSLKVYTDKRFGHKHFKGALWDDKPEVTKTHSFTLRCGGNNSFTTRINDALVQTLFGTHVADVDWQAYEPVIVYINGAYKGVYGLRERSNKDYVEANYDGLDDIEVADESSYKASSSKEGTLFQELYDAYSRRDVTYEELAALIDTANFVATVAAELYGKNTDWPTNNVSLWRPTADGGRWRWILKDMDRFGMQHVLYPESFNMFSYLFGKGDGFSFKDESFALYQRMAAFPEFQQALADRLSVYLGDFLRPDVVTARIDSMDAEIRPEVKATFAAYNFADDYYQYTTGLKRLKTFVSNRPAILYKQMADFFRLGSVVPLTVAADSVPVRMNGTMLTEGDFQGSFFTDYPLRLTADSTHVSWKLSVIHADSTVTDTLFAGPSVQLLLGRLLGDGDSASFSIIRDEDEPKNDEDDDDNEEGEGSNEEGEDGNEEDEDGNEESEEGDDDAIGSPYLGGSAVYRDLYGRECTTPHGLVIVQTSEGNHKKILLR